MLQWILFFTLTWNALALEISLSGAKEDFQNFSALHMKNQNPFVCQEIINDFKVVTKIVCAFRKKPSVKLKVIQNSFFKIDNIIKKKIFFLIITPHEKMKLYPVLFDMTTDITVYNADTQKAKHWMVVGYKDTLPFIKEEKKVDTSINFPFTLVEDMIPYVGSLDIKGNPVHLKRVGDVTDYLKIKQLYKDEEYVKCLELVEDVMEDFPNSLFYAELLYYKIRVYSKLDDNDNVIEMSKAFLREYSSDENVPEVLSLIARGYSVIGMNSDADYFFDRLFSEHEASEYAKWGYIYKGQMLEASASFINAVKFYTRALNETQDVTIAVNASYRLALYHLTNEERKESSKFVLKIINTSPEFFMNDLVTSMEMMYNYADNGDYITAASIAKAITDATNKSHDEYERLVKDRGIWLSKAGDKLKALEALNAYIAEFKYGTYEEVVAIAKDELFFDTNDGNYTEKLSAYNKLIDDYANDSIGDRAIYEKAKLLEEHEKYEDVLDFERIILTLDDEVYKDIGNIIYNSALGVMTKALRDKKCQEVLDLSNDYNITLSNEWDNGLYDCAMMGGDYLLAKEITSRNIKSKNIAERKQWLLRHIKVDFSTGNYSEVIDASLELIVLIEDEPKSKYNEIYRILFDTYQRLEEKEKLLGAMATIEKIFGNDYVDIDRYVAVMSIGSDLRDDTIVLKYGEQIMKIQNASKSYAQSPFVEFTLYQAYTNKEDLQKALNSIESLNTLELSASNRARQKYLLGTALSKLWRDDEAQEAYQEAIDIDPSSAWAKLAQSAKNI
ncbi:flagellar protein [Sulfurimonas sp. SAG-AH-194-I05]|nr:flagellar protein [Sulfurimonas sp. SAG-AH-194-I05]MDF1874784.1 flagellar protein [Sulfurimonas sp. SAG-AH-194-I05]